MDNDITRQEGDDSYTKVDVEIMEEQPNVYTQPLPQFIMSKPPIWTTWILLAITWLFLGSSIPFTILIGLPLNLAALILAVVCLTRGGVATGVLVLIMGTVGSFIVYLTGLFMFLGKFAVT